jgi:hypothetical protein
MPKIFVLSTIIILFITTGSFAENKYLTDKEVRQQMINESISAYPGKCPCPYNLTRNGARCGKRSAYSRPGGYSPLCYPSDISDKEVQNYRKEHGILKPTK